MTITPEQLAAYADGELSGAQLDEIELAIAADPSLARKVKEHRALKASLLAHFAPIVDQPVPDRLTRMLSGQREHESPENEISENIVNFGAARERHEAKRAIPRWGWMVGPAIAASLALAVFVPRGGNETPEFAAPQLAMALDQQLVATQAPGADTRILLSFRNKDGDLCRAYSGAEAGGIACREKAGWRLREVVQGSEVAAGEYRQAGADDGALLAIVQDMAAGSALDNKQETAARQDGWQ